MLFTLPVSAQLDSPFAGFANLERYAAANRSLQVGGAGGIVLIGNSITEGWARQDPEFFRTHGLIGRGISGQTSAQLLLRFRQDVIDLSPRAVVIHIGTNDIAENTGPYDPHFTLGNIVSMVELARANDIEVAIASVLPATAFGWRPGVTDAAEKIKALNAELKKYAADHDVLYIDYYALLTNARGGLDTDLASDGVHPSAEGYAIMEQVLLSGLKGI